MSKKLTTAEEFLAWMAGIIPSFVLNAAVKKQKIPALFDWLNLPVLIAAVTVTAIHLYLKLKKKESTKLSNFLFAALLGWFLGSWLVSRFVNS